MAPAEISAQHNPLRSPKDHRLNRIAGPSSLIIFGVTGDLSRKKLMPAVYDLANRGLLPPGFALVGFARRDWDDQDFEQVVHDSVQQYARTEFREDVWKQLARRASGSCRATSTTTRPSTGCATTVDELDVERGTMGNHAFYLSIPPKDVPARRRAAEAIGPHRAAPTTSGAASSSRSRSGPTCSPRAR